MFSEFIQHQSQVLGMILLVLGKDQNVIEIDQDEVICVGVEYEVHHTRECWRGIGKPKRHDSALIRAKARSESCLWDIFFTDVNLVIPHMEVNLGKHLCTFELLKQFIDVGKWVFILDCLLVQWAVIDAKSFCAIFLLDKKAPHPQGDEIGLIRPRHSCSSSYFFNSFSSSGPSL